jgi:hypothetical protein
MLYRTLAPLTLQIGVVVGITELQAQRRARLLQEVRPGYYRAVQPVQFKAGELIVIDGQISKADAVSLELAAPAAAAPNVTALPSPIPEARRKPRGGGPFAREA